MYRILVVDDEPRVSTGIRNYLLGSALDITHVETALNGFEALDYLRMDTFDLVLTDIQMGMMNGIELMEAIYLEQPQLPIIVISAHEKFDFAKRSLRLGARDYLIKPVELDELIRVVGGVLQEKMKNGRQALEQRAPGSDRSEDAFARRRKALVELLTEKNLQAADYAELLQEAGGFPNGAHFGVIAVEMDVSRSGFSRREITRSDRKLLKYASINIVEESLADWRGLAFYGLGNRLIAVIQLDDPDVSVGQVSVKSQLNLIGQLVGLNLKQYLNVEAAVGMSTLSPDPTALSRLLEEASEASEWRKLHPENQVFYYEDMIGPSGIHYMQWVTKVNRFVERLKLTDERPSAPDLEEIERILTEHGHSEEQFNSYFGLLIYRLYGLLLDYGQNSPVPLRRFDPDVYFRDMPTALKPSRLVSYVLELSELLHQCRNEQDRSIVAQVADYIRMHYANHGLKVQDIAGEVHFSPAYVGYLFKKVMKVNLWEYVTEVRIEEAKRLLATTDRKRYEIAYQVGYESPEHFSRIFKRCAGVSPAEYRKERQEEGFD